MLGEVLAQGSLEADSPMEYDSDPSREHHPRKG